MDNNIGVSIYFTKRDDIYFQEEGKHCGWEGGRRGVAERKAPSMGCDVALGDFLGQVQGRQI